VCYFYFGKLKSTEVLSSGPRTIMKNSEKRQLSQYVYWYNYVIITVMGTNYFKCRLTTPPTIGLYATLKVI
jgi:hypothetical protein